LANRRRFERKLEREVSRTLRYEHPFCLLMLDIDNFKRVNDTFGHSTGDDVIRRIGKVLHEGTRGIDLAARIGGEEFGLILAETNLEGGLEVADRLRLAVGKMSVPLVGHITASVGVAECPASAQTVHDLLVSADSAMYEAKRAGKDRVAANQPMKSNSAPAADVQTDQQIVAGGVDLSNG
jgi:diguanylate cyclase (GGDEF)-like protein